MQDALHIRLRPEMQLFEDRLLLAKFGKECKSLRDGEERPGHSGNYKMQCVGGTQEYILFDIHYEFLYSPKIPFLSLILNG